MPFYQDSGTLCQVLTDLFQRAMNDPQAARALLDSGMVLRMDITDPAAMITVNGKQRPPQFVCGLSNGHADLVLHGKMDTMHQVWLGKVKLADAFFGRQIRVEGSTLRALSLAELFRRVEAIYPTVLRDHGLLTPR